jgi:iron(III) transport system substrate-binding protein
MSQAQPATRRGRLSPPVRPPILAALVALIAVACSGAATPTPTGSPAAPPVEASVAPSAPATVVGGTITLYTSVTQATVDAVAGGFHDAYPDVTLDVFRAPTAEVAARIATDLASGGLRADVLWLTDPLSIAAYADQGLLQAWTPPSAGAIDAAYRTDTFFGTRLLNMVMVTGSAVRPGPADWKDLLRADYRGKVAMPDPGFAGSAFAALGYFSQTAGYGTAFYQALKDNGTVQVKAPDDVTTGVAEGAYLAGITLDNSARTAIKKGSPIAMAWPSSGPIAIYSPIAAVAASPNLAAADAFVDYSLSLPGQARIAGTGWQPVVGPGGPAVDGRQVSPDWAAAFGKQKELLASYRAIFGG